MRLQQTSIDPLSAANAALQLRQRSGAAVLRSGYIERTDKPLADIDAQSRLFSKTPLPLQHGKKLQQSAPLQESVSFGTPFLGSRDKELRNIVQVRPRQAAPWKATASLPMWLT